MAIREIVHYGHPALRKENQPVEEITAEVKELVQDMLDTLHQAKGLGLAAPQVGVNLRIFIADLSAIDFDAEALAVINPEIIERKGEVSGEEGCLSFPGLYFNVNRAEQIEMTFMDPDGNKHRIKAYGMTARVLQHEYDHLDATLYIDHLSAAERDLFAGKLKKIKVG